MLRYNLSVNISIRNSNKIERISYYRFRAHPSCYGNDLDLVSLTPFQQGTKNTTLFHHVFQGNSMLKLRGSQLRDFNNDQRDGSYSIYVYLYLETELKHAGGGNSGFKVLIAKCGLFRLHLLGSSSSSSSNNQSGIGGLFQAKRCKISAGGHKDDSY
ncbi:hypothetical protein MKX03_000988 [Papaver bracteatum]|nr:hypothetical protein MKX03_000988 [Papaver bracteatum]